MKITYQNDNNDTYEFNWAYNLAGFASGEVTIQSAQGYNLSGAQYRGSTVGGRVYSLSFDDVCESKADLTQRRFEFEQIFNPLIGGYLYMETSEDLFFTRVYVAEGPIPLAMGESTVDSYDISFWSPNHDIKKASEYSVKMTGYQGGLHLPYTLPYRLGTQADIVNINYGSNIGAPILLEFHGPAIKPRILKHQTGEYVEVNQTLLSGETLWIDTTPGDINIYMLDSSGNTVQADQKVTPTSDFFLLTKGVNTLEFATGSNDQTNNDVYIHYYERYLGV